MQKIIKQNKIHFYLMLIFFDFVHYLILNNKTNMIFFLYTKLSIQSTKIIVKKKNFFYFKSLKISYVNIYKYKNV